jgi:threonine/homoserine/homoserine lactone efflux protein
MNILSFFISSLIIVLIPGTGVIYTISTGITKGKKASLYAALGCTAGIIPHLCLSIALYSLMLQMGNRVFNIVKIAGALYLLYLGIRMVISKSKLNFEGSQGDLKALAIVRQGILINLLNPKLTVFFFSFLPQYISANYKNYFLQSFMLGLAFMLLTLIVFIGYGILASNAKRFIEKSTHTSSILQKCFGLIFVIFAVQLGFSSI